MVFKLSFYSRSCSGSFLLCITLLGETSCRLFLTSSPITEGYYLVLDWLRPIFVSFTPASKWTAVLPKWS
jgi:hypothetical protein